jgi:hypothetical protein
MQKDPHNGRMITTPPRLSGLRLQQSSFRRLIEPILWNYILDNDNDLKEAKEVEELSSSDEEDASVISLTPPLPPYLIAASIRVPPQLTMIHLTNIHIFLEHLVMKMITLIQLNLLL